MKKVLSSVLLTVSAIAFGQVFSAGFETNNGPLTNWTLYNQDGLTPNTNVDFVNAAWVAAAAEFGNNVALSTSWYDPSGTSNDWMVSPAITLPAGTNTLYWHAISYASDFKESYKVYISTTGNAVSNFTTPLLTVNDEGSTWQNRSIDLSAYAGQTIYIAFQNFSNDKYLGAIDNVHILNGTSPQPGRVMTKSNVTQTSVKLNWVPATGVTGYDYSVGNPGHSPAVTGSVVGASSNFVDVTSGLSADTVYEYYIRSKNGPVNGSWIGPYRFFTAQPFSSGTYSYGFDNTAAGFYQNDGWDGNWGVNATAGNPQAGAQIVFSNNSTSTATNSWLFSKPFNLSAGNTYTISFYVRNFAASPIPSQRLKLTIGNEATEAAQSNTIWSSTTLNNAGWTQFTANFTPTSSGTYYFGFNHFSPMQTKNVSLALDTFNITTSSLNTDEIKIGNASLLIYPNPTSDILNIKTDAKVNGISVFDMSGRRVDVKYEDNKVNVKSLPSGNYLINIETETEKIIEKFIKK